MAITSGEGMGLGCRCVGQDEGISGFWDVPGVWGFSLGGFQGLGFGASKLQISWLKALGWSLVAFFCQAFRNAGYSSVQELVGVCAFILMVPTVASRATRNDFGKMTNRCKAGTLPSMTSWEVARFSFSFIGSRLLLFLQFYATR